MKLATIVLAFCAAVILDSTAAVADEHEFKDWQRHLIGAWRLGDEPFVDKEVEYRLTREGVGLIGEWTQIFNWHQQPARMVATEIVGFQRDSKSIKSVCFGLNGIRWEIDFERIENKRLVGKYFVVYPAGNVMKMQKGRVTISREGDDVLFVEATHTDSDSPIKRSYRVFRQGSGKGGKAVSCTD
ncbi:MAG: hypothetical protein ACE361_21025 [Aureliella sp.]